MNDATRYDVLMNWMTLGMAMSSAGVKPDLVIKVYSEALDKMMESKPDNTQLKELKTFLAEIKTTPQ